MNKPDTGREYKSSYISYVLFPSDDQNFSRYQIAHLTFCPLAQRNFVAHSSREVQKLLVAVEVQFCRNPSAGEKYFVTLDCSTYELWPKSKDLQGKLHVVYPIVSETLRRVVRVAPAETPVPLLSHVRAVELRYFDFSVPDVWVVLVESKNRF